MNNSILKTNIKLTILFLTIVFIDQLTKYFVRNNILNIKYQNLYLFTINFAKNNGAAFNIFSNNQLFLLFVSVISSIVLVYLLFYGKNIRKFDKYALSFILGGSLGNGADRLIYGYVTDFIDLNFINFPIFNIADISINIGFFLIIFSFLRKGN
tara:strand:+ start:1067 stop:1528 length:462 start_codon:yes stop_codon:yes gene_type:complete